MDTKFDVLNFVPDCFYFTGYYTELITNTPQSTQSINVKDGVLYVDSMYCKHMYTFYICKSGVIQSKCHTIYMSERDWIATYKSISHIYSFFYM